MRSTALASKVAAACPSPSAAPWHRTRRQIRECGPGMRAPRARASSSRSSTTTTAPSAHDEASCGAHQTGRAISSPAASGFASASNRPISAWRSGGISSTVPASTRSDLPGRNQRRAPSDRGQRSRFALDDREIRALRLREDRDLAGGRIRHAFGEGERRHGLRAVASRDVEQLLRAGHRPERTGEHDTGGQPPTCAGESRLQRAPSAPRPRPSARAGSSGAPRPAAPTATNPRPCVSTARRDAPGRVTLPIVDDRRSSSPCHCSVAASASAPQSGPATTPSPVMTTARSIASRRHPPAQAGRRRSRHRSRGSTKWRTADRARAAGCR